MYFLLLN